MPNKSAPAFAAEHIEHITTASLVPYARNARTHAPHQVQRIAASIREFGFTVPVLIDANNGIIAGHGRVLAAQLLQRDTVPCIRLAHLTETQKRAYIIADNKLALDSEWDTELLTLELQDLAGAGFDLNSTGLDTLLPDASEAAVAAILDNMDHGDSEEVTALTAGVRRGILIDFDLHDFEQAQDLIRIHRESGTYIGGVLLQALREAGNAPEQ